MIELSLIQKLAAMALPVIFAVTVHEASHAWVADKLGDKTARSLGRVTFNPIPHIDLFGTVILPLGLFALGTLLSGVGFLFGYAKPVPVVFSRLHNPRRDMALVALAGPGANLIMAVLWAMAFRFAGGILESMPTLAEPMAYMAIFGVMINIFLMVLNLIPLLPLDGGRVLASLLPPRLAMQYAKLEPYGLIILLGLLISGLLTPIILPIALSLQSVLLGIPMG